MMDFLEASVASLRSALVGAVYLEVKWFLQVWPDSKSLKEPGECEKQILILLNEYVALRLSLPMCPMCSGGWDLGEGNAGEARKTIKEEIQLGAQLRASCHEKQFNLFLAPKTMNISTLAALMISARKINPKMTTCHSEFQIPRMNRMNFAGISWIGLLALLNNSLVGDPEIQRISRNFPAFPWRGVQSSNLWLLTYQYFSL